jgi:hypothetical protein
VAGEIPRVEAERGPEGDDVEHVVLHSGRVRARRLGRLSTTTLVVEHDLSPDGERREGGPEEIVAVDQAAVDGQERRGTGDRW